MSYEIVIDSTCDLNKEIRNRFGIYPEYLKTVIYLPNKEMQCDLEWENLSEKEYYKIVKSKIGAVKTAFAPYNEFVRVIEPILEEGKDVIIFALSSGISGTYNAYVNFANVLGEDYPNNKIHVVDTLKYGPASGLLAIAASENKKKGMLFDENVKWCEENKMRLHQSGTLDDLRFLAKNGRITATKAFFGSLVGVQPHADFNTKGLTEPLGTLKGKDAANEFSLKYMLKTATNLDDQIVVISHSMRKERAEQFKEQLLKVCHPRDVIIACLGQSCGANCGPGLTSYNYFGDVITDSREKEVAVFNELKGNK